MTDWQYRWHYDKCPTVANHLGPSQWYDYKQDRSSFTPSPGVTIEWREKPAEPVTLTLDAESAGYLVDLLSRHVAGVLVNYDQPLGRIRMALMKANVKRLYAENRNTSYAALYERDNPKTDPDPF